MTFYLKDQQSMIDEASIFCRQAVKHITTGNWEAACGVLMGRVRELDMALQSLTPGGSDYVADPERCVARVREQMNTYRELWREAVAKHRN